MNSSAKFDTVPRVAFLLERIRRVNCESKGRLASNCSIRMHS